MRKLEAIDWCAVIALIVSAGALVVMTLQVDASEKEVRLLRQQLATEKQLAELEQESADATIASINETVKTLTNGLEVCLSRPAKTVTRVVVERERPVPAFERGKRFDE